MALLGSTYPSNQAAWHLLVSSRTKQKIVAPKQGDRANGLLVLVEGDVLAASALPASLAQANAVVLRHTVYRLLGKKRQLLGVDETSVPLLLDCGGIQLTLAPSTRLSLLPSSERICERAGSEYDSLASPRAATSSLKAVPTVPRVPSSNSKLLIVDSSLPVRTHATVLGRVSSDGDHLVMRSTRVVLHRGRRAALALLPGRWWAGAALTASGVVGCVLGLLARQK